MTASVPAIMAIESHVKSTRVDAESLQVLSLMLSSFAITPLAAPTSMLGDKGLSGMTAEQSNKTAKNAWPHPNVAQSVHPAAEHATKHTILSLKMDKFLVIVACSVAPPKVPSLRAAC